MTVKRTCRRDKLGTQRTSRTVFFGCRNFRLFLSSGQRNRVGDDIPLLTTTALHRAIYSAYTHRHLGETFDSV